MASKNDEVVRAAQLGLAGDEILNVIAKLGLQPEDASLQKSLVLAAAQGHAATLQTLVGFGVPVGAKDGGHLALTAASESGHDVAVKLLCSLKADVEQRNENGLTAMNVAVKGNHMPVVKELLRHGATVAPSDKVPGMAEAVNSMEIDTLIVQLKKCQHDVIDPNVLLVADEAVWIAMRKHMDLVTRKEKQKAALTLVDLEAKLESELALAAKAKEEEKKVAAELEEKRVLLQAAQSDANMVQKEIDEVIGTQYKLQDMFNKMSAEHKKVSDELKAALKEKEEATAEREKREQYRDELLAKKAALDDENAKLNKSSELLSSELHAAKKELLDWQKDQLAAAQLTAQAQKILGTGSVQEHVATDSSN